MFKINLQSKNIVSFVWHRKLRSATAYLRAFSWRNYTMHSHTLENKGFFFRRWVCDFQLKMITERLSKYFVENHLHLKEQRPRPAHKTYEIIYLSNHTQEKKALM